MEVNRLKRGWLAGKKKLLVTSPFGQRHGRMHQGVDIGTPVGTKILAPFKGKLTARQQGGGRKGYGNYLLLKSGNVELLFGHLSKMIISPNSTITVNEGSTIGYTGGKRGAYGSGSSTGPHLHFEFHLNGKKYNPKYIISDALVGKVRQNSISDEYSIIPVVGEKYSDDVTDNQKKIEVSQLDEDLSNSEDVSDETSDTETEGDDITEYETEDAFVAGIWQICKLVIDSDVANYRIHDAAVSIQTGPLNNFFNKVCQKPLVEFAGDTFGDQYYFMVRKPPFDKETMKQTLKEQNLLDEKDNNFTIYERDIISSNLSFNNQNIYSWYQYIPMYEMGATEDLQYIIPAVLFPEYASIWGSRNLTVNSQYRNFIDSDVRDKLSNGEKTIHGDAEARYSLIDLHYLVESNAYNPFTRGGTIQIMGNRKIKRGMFIQINWDDMMSPEIFYVDSVTNDYSVSENSVNRTTTLNLSHGMIKSFMFFDDNIENTNSYFNLIDFGKYNKMKKTLNLDNWKECISSWKVNTDIFMFFLKKLQFITNINGYTKTAEVIVKSSYKK